MADNGKYGLLPRIVGDLQVNVRHLFIHNPNYPQLGRSATSVPTVTGRSDRVKNDACDNGFMVGYFG